MKNFYIKLQITKEIEVVDCKNLEEAKQFVLNQLQENPTFIDDDEITITEA
jgi:hypothetical protein